MTTEVSLLRDEMIERERPRFRTLDLRVHRNNIGITHAADTALGAFNIWRNSLPAEELPIGQTVVVAGIPFLFPPVDSGRSDNVRCEGQVVTVPGGRYDWLHVLAAGERRVEDELGLYFADGSVEFSPLRLSDFWHAPAVFGEHEAFATATMHYPQHVQQNVSAKIWCQRVPIIGRRELASIGLPNNAAVHIFAATLGGDRS